MASEFYDESKELFNHQVYSLNERGDPIPELAKEQLLKVPNQQPNDIHIKLNRYASNTDFLDSLNEDFSCESQNFNVPDLTDTSEDSRRSSRDSRLPPPRRELPFNDTPPPEEVFFDQAESLGGNWTEGTISDLAKRRRARKKLKRRLEDLERRANTSQNDTSSEHDEQPQTNNQIIENAIFEEGCKANFGIETSGCVATTVSHMSPERSAIRSSLSSLGNSSHATEYESATSSDFDDEVNDSNYSTLQPLIGLVLEELFSAFFYGQFPVKGCYELEHTEGAGPDPQKSAADAGQLDTTNYSSSTRANGKRKRGEGEDQNSGDEDRGDEERRPPKKLLPNPPLELQDTFWACPFSKWKPLTYRKCCQYILKDVSRVKQHLRRYHERPTYCPICWEVFQVEDEFERHIQSRGCSSEPKKDIEGVTSAQQKQLERRSEKQLSKPEQWYAIYEILFPGQPRPNSPYIDSDLSAELLSFQRFMATDGLAIVERIARENIPLDLMPREEEILAFSQILFQRSIPEILQRYDAARPQNTGFEIPTGPKPAKTSNDGSDPGYGTLSETGTCNNAGQDQRGISDEPSSSAVEDIATYQDTAEETRAQGPTDQTSSLYNPQGQPSGLLNLEGRIQMPTSTEPTNVRIATPEFDFEEFLTTMPSNDDFDWTTVPGDVLANIR